MKYTELKIYCDRENLTYKEFWSRVDPTGEIHWNSIYRAITGRGTPGKKVRRALDKFISRNRKKIEKVLSGAAVPLIGGGNGMDAGEYQQAV